MRLFIAIELPDAVKQTLGRLRTEIPGARWVVPDQLHLTLAFLGETDQETAQSLTTKLADIQARGFDLRFGSTGCFPDKRRPRVVWIGFEPEPLLQKLAALVRAAVLASGIPQEERPFSPHITLARLRAPASIAGFPDGPVAISSVPVREFTLFESRLTSSGAIHTAIRSFGLLDPPLE
ncbi:RNA 2',3'-cyclic phosphodiesterase [Geobacter sp. SVR]|uniref:RNA 2',3'-cyclic phosphodiesterase n=1 Tax=Geobacter sp. SVR TaxID=2495594 RepID=UPI00143F023D|nr:RNA 2',3'-cyclic phosphodiesterase [Geobacter sp. SVR]BCS53944.1 RNA 2',3'-cyclic phosphodiesterase [Geobacter sp. SVR]GCF86275.1 RNA 2',3'-cyclic phosphodiesterase [Geobacter sp. SVR]